MINVSSQPLMPSCDGSTNSTLPPDFYNLSDAYKVVVGTAIFFGVLPFVLFEFRWFPLGTLFSTLFAALLMVPFQVVSHREVYGTNENSYLTTVFTLLGIQLLGYFFQREEVILKIFRKALKPYLQFEEYLVRVCALCFIFSVFLTGDGCAAIVTPVLLKFWESQERHKMEIESLALAIMTSCNIGSMTLIFSGLPIILVMAKTNNWRFEHSSLDMRACIMYLLPVAGVTFLMNVAFLLIHYKIQRRRSNNSATLVSDTSQLSEAISVRHQKDVSTTPNGHVSLHVQNKVYDGVYYGPELSVQRSDDRISVPCQLETILEDEILEISSSQSVSYLDADSPSSRRQLDHGYHSEATILDSDDDENADAASTSSSSSSSMDTEREERNRIMCNTDDNLHQLNISYRPSALQSQTLRSSSQDLRQYGYEFNVRWGISRSLTAFSVYDFIPDELGEHPGSESVAFWACLGAICTAMLGMVVAACYTNALDVGLVPLAAGILAVVTDVALNRRPATQLLQNTSWSFVLLLLGLFVWTRGFCNTGLARAAWGSCLDHNILRTVLIGAFVCFGTNILGPVPTVLLALDVLEPCARQRFVSLYTVVFATLAGNASLFGSACNLIVAQKCSQVLKHRISFCSHLRFGFPTSVGLILVGAGLLYGLLQIDVP